MKIKLKDPNLRIHGKLHKRDPYYFRHHYGEQRLVYISKPYIDCPTEKQKASRQAFTALRKEVARQLHDPVLRTRWEAHFHQDPQGYKMLHTYVYAKLKAGENIACRDALLCVSPNVPQEQKQQIDNSLPTRENNRDAQKSVSTSGAARGRQPNIALLVAKGVIMPIFLPSKVPKPILIKIG